MREIEREDEFSSAKSKRTNAYIIMHSRKNAHTFPRVRAFSLRGVPTRTQRSLVSGGVARVASRRSRRRSVFLFLFAVLRFFYLFLLLASLSLSFCPHQFPVRERKKKSSSSNGDGRLATVASRGSLAIRARRIYTTAPERITKTGGGRKRRRKRRRRTLFFLVYVCV